MIKKLLLVLLAVILIATAGYYFFHGTTDKELIYKELKEFVAIASKQQGEGTVCLALRHGKISDMVASPCVVNAKEVKINGFFSSLEFASKIIHATQMVRYAKGSIENVKICVDQDQQTATADFSVNVSGEHKDGKRFDEARDVKATLRKIDKQWKFTSFDVREVLEQ